VTTVTKRIRVSVPVLGLEVGAILTRPPEATSLLVFGHGAGAGMEHSFMEACADGLRTHGVATLRYLFPYLEAGRKAPDRPSKLVATVRAAISEARRLEPKLPLFAGGKSMGGRMTSTAASEESLDGVRGLVFFGFPLHAAGKDSNARGAHLAEVGIPMLFLQGTRDKLANLALLTPLVEALHPTASLHVVDGADHGFHVLKRSGRTDEAVVDELCRECADWMSTLR
jgi:predicted alpha/beta-hydrolase family hydrolase